MAKVTARMSTEVALNLLKASESLNSLKTVVNSTTKAWKAQEAQMKSSGDYLGAAKERFEGLGGAIKEQQTYIDGLKTKQSELQGNTESTAKQYLQYQKQIDSATVHLKSMEAQQQRAREQMQYQRSGLASLQSEYKLNNKAVEVHAQRLEAEGKAASSTVSKYNGLRQSTENLTKQYEIQAREAKQLATENESMHAKYEKMRGTVKQVGEEFGTNSQEYKQAKSSLNAFGNEVSESDSKLKKQNIRLDETGKSMAETKNKTKSMQAEINKLHPTGIKRIDNAVVKVKDRTGAMAVKAKESFAKFKSAAITASIGVGILGSAMVKGAKQASELQNIYNENVNLLVSGGEKTSKAQKEVNAMQAQGRKLSVQYGESQANIAKGYQELIKRGYSGAQAIGAMGDMLKASKASGDGFSDTMTVTATTIEQFNLKQKNMAKGMSESEAMLKATKKTTNTLASAADLTSASFASLGEGMNYVGGVAANAHMSVDKTAAALGELSNRGLEGTRAGTGLARVINRLMKPTAAGAKAMKAYGLSIKDFTDKQGNLKDMADVFDLIKEKVPKGKRVNFFNNLFGAEGQQAASFLSASTKELKDLNGQVAGAYKNDYVGGLAKKNMKSAQNQIKQFKEAGNLITTEIGGAMLPAMAKFSKAMTKALTSKDGQAGLKAIAKGLGKVMSAIGNVVKFIGKHSKGVATFGKVMLAVFAGAKLLKGIQTMTSLMTTFGISLDIATGPIGAVVLAVTALAAIAIVVKDNWKPISKFFSKMWDGIKKGASAAWKSIKKTFASVGKWFSGVWASVSKGARSIGKKISKPFKDGVKDIKDFFKGLGKWFSNIWDSIAKGAKAGWNLIKKAVSIGATAVKYVALAPLIVLAAMIVSVWNKIKKPTMAVWNWMKSHISAVAKVIKNTVVKWFDALKNSIAKIWNAVKKATSAVWNPIKKFVVNTAKEIWNQDKKIFTALKNTITKIWNAIKNATAKVWNPIKKFLINIAKSIKDTVTKWFNSLKNSVTGIWNAVKKNTIGVWNSVGKWLGSKSKAIGGSVSKAFTGLKDSLSKIMDTISSKWHKTWTAMSDFFGKIWTSIKKSAKGGINGVIGWLNGGIGGINKVIHTFGGSKNAIGKIPKLAKGGSTKGLGMVNDGAGEEAIIKNGKAYKVNGKNAIVKFDGDETVIPHEESRAMFGETIKHYAKGSKNWFSSLTGWIKDKWDGIVNFIKHPIKALENITSKAIGKISGSSFIKKFTPAMNTGFIRGIWKKFKSMLQDLKTAHDDDGGSFDGSMGAHGVYAYLWKVAQKAMKKFGMRFTSGYRPGDPYGHGHHQAVDIAWNAGRNGDSAYKKAANWVFDTFKKQVAYVITQGQVRDRKGSSGTGIHNGWKHWPDNDHYDHLHINGMWGPNDIAKGGGKVTGGHKNWLKQAGFKASEIAAANWIVTHESGWRTNATNGGSGAYGLPQSLPGSKMASAGSDWRTNPLTQLKWMKSYIRGRYGNANSAKAFWQSHNWYENGGFSAKAQLAHLSEGNKLEAIIPLDAMKSSRAMKLLSQVVAKIAQDNPQTVSETSLESVSHDDLSKLNEKFDTLLSMFGQLLGLNGAQLQAIKDGAFDKNKLYEQQAKDQGNSDWQAI